MKNTQQFTDQVVLVTGAGRGLGEGCARIFAERGASVILTDISPEPGQSLAEEIEKTGGKALFILQDVSVEADWKRVLAVASDRFGKVDVLVNNAGIIEFAPLNEMSVDTFDRSMRVNMRSVFLGCKLVLPLMQAAGGGAIVNVSSISAMIGHSAGGTAYSASKGAIRAFTKAAALDYVKFGIRVNSVHPGSIATPVTQPYLDDPKTRPLALGRTPMDRPSEPREIAAVIAFLASTESSFMTGTELVVDGGWLAS